MLPTGAGKTAMAAALARRLSVPSLFLVNRLELVEQALKAGLAWWPGAAVGAIQGDRDEWTATLWGREPEWCVGMVQTLQGGRLSRIPTDRFGLVIGDEAHFAPSEGYRRILDYFRPGFRLGLTATPERADGVPLGPLFGDEPLYVYTLFQAIKDKVLCEIAQQGLRTEVELPSAVGNDFSAEELTIAVDTDNRNAIVVQAYLDRAKGRKAIAFCVGVEHAQHLSAALNAAGVKAEAVHGGQEVEERARAIERHKAGQISVLCNCEILTFGFDGPWVDCLLMARPTFSRTLYIQMIGRGLRISPGKKDCLVIDFTDNCRTHKLVCSLDLRGKEDREVSPPAAPREGGPPPELPSPTEVPVVAWTLEEVCPWPGMPTLEG